MEIKSPSKSQIFKTLGTCIVLAAVFVQSDGFSETNKSLKKPQEWKFAISLPRGSNAMNNLISTVEQKNQFKDDSFISVLTNPKVRSIAEAEAKTLNGTWQGVLLHGEALRRHLPQITEIEHPFLYKDLNSWLKKSTDIAATKGKSESSLTLLGILPLGTLRIFTHKKHTLSAFEKRVFWTLPGDTLTQQELLKRKALIKESEIKTVLALLKNDQIDSIIAPPAAVLSMQWHTQLNAMSDAIWGYAPGGLFWNKKHWNLLSKKDQQTLKILTEQSIAQWVKDLKVEEGEAIGYLKSLGFSSIQ